MSAGSSRASWARSCTARLVGQAIQALVEEGPSLGRPLVDRVKRAALHNLKELRPGSSGSSEIRILFIFDPERNAVLLTAGDKAGQWSEWYRHAIPAAEAHYAAWLEHLVARRQQQQARDTKETGA
jgi:hypothetical protein